MGRRLGTLDAAWSETQALARALVLLELQQQLIEAQAEDIVRLRLERDDARRVHDLLAAIRHEQELLSVRLTGGLVTERGVQWSA